MGTPGAPQGPGSPGGLAGIFQPQAFRFDPRAVPAARDFFGFDADGLRAAAALVRFVPAVSYTQRPGLIRHAFHFQASSPFLKPQMQR